MKNKLKLEKIQCSAVGFILMKIYNIQLNFLKEKHPVISAIADDSTFFAITPCSLSELSLKMVTKKFLKSHLDLGLSPTQHEMSRSMLARKLEV